MNRLKVYNHRDIKSYISTRKGEVKFGERLNFVSSIEELSTTKAKYVIFGIPEDIGVRANHGKPGTSKAWETAIKSLVNIQLNRYNNPENVILLGELDCQNWMEKASNIAEDDPNYFAKMGDIVKQIDAVVSDTVQKIIEAGKTPVIIGGGHNNAYGNIKGASKAISDPINVMNIDAHTDLRQLEHRHSGNGFSYAIEGQYLRKYHVFGLHKNYTPEYIFEEMENCDNLSFSLLQDLAQFPDEMNRRFSQELEKLKTHNFGLELDCDSIAGFSSSAISPAGFTVNEVRNFIQLSAKEVNCRYLHICEAAPTKENSAEIGKALSYFISDFIR